MLTMLVVRSMVRVVYEKHSQCMGCERQMSMAINADALQDLMDNIQTLLST